MLIDQLFYGFRRRVRRLSRSLTKLLIRHGPLLSVDPPALGRSGANGPPCLHFSSSTSLPWCSIRNQSAGGGHPDSSMSISRVFKGRSSAPIHDRQPLHATSVIGGKTCLRPAAFASVYGHTSAGALISDRCARPPCGPQTYQLSSASVRGGTVRAACCAGNRRRTISSDILDALFLTSVSLSNPPSTSPPAAA
jgi:hypothetical protein